MIVSYGNEPACPLRTKITAKPPSLPQAQRDTTLPHAQVKRADNDHKLCRESQEVYRCRSIHHRQS